MVTMPIKVIALDLFGTVFNPAGVPIEEKRAYVKQFTDKVYSRMKLPASWQNMSAFPDSKEGIQLLRSKYKVVTCSNWDYVTTWKCLAYNDIQVDEIIEVHEVQAYKPKLVTYAHVCDVMQVEPSEVLFVTGNNPGPDVHNPTRIGMKTIVIRHGYPHNLLELAGELGC